MRRLSAIPLLSVLTALILVISPATAQDQAALDLVNKAIAAHGGADAIATQEDSGTAEGKIVSYFPARNEARFKACKRGGDTRLDIEIAGLKMTLVVTGDGGWMERAGQVADLPELVKKQMAQSDAHTMKVLLLAGKPETEARSIGEWALPDGREAPGVEIRAADRATTKFYFDPETHLIAKVEFNGENFSTGAMSKFESYPSDYRDVGGIPVAFATDEYTDGEKTQTTILDKIDLTTQVASSLFERPEPATLGQRLAEPVTVPMAYVTRDAYAAMDPKESQGKLVVPNEIAAVVSINGHDPVNCLVDTGAGLTVIDEAYAKKIALKVGEAMNAGAAGGGVEAKVAHVDSIRMGSAEVKDTQVLVIDMSMIAGREGPTLDVVVGYNFLNQFITQIDYQGRTLTFSDPNQEPDLGPGQVAVPMDLHGGMPAIKAVLNGSEEITMRVDTGAGGTTIPKRIADALNPKKTVPGGMGMGADKRLVQHTAMLLDSFAIGDLRVDRVPVSFPSGESPEFDPTGSTMESTGLGLLGNDILSLFRVGIDYERQRLILERAPGAEPSMDDFCKVGIAFEPTVKRGDETLRVEVEKRMLL
jgi:predicted aspartyl protease